MEKSKRKDDVQRSIDKVMKKVEKEEEKKAIVLQNCNSKMQFMFAQNFKKECDKQNIKGKTAKEILGITASDLSEYKTGKLDIKLEKLEKIADRLNVSPFYLLGVTNNPKPMPIILSSMIYGLSLEARYSLMMLYYGCDIEDYREIEIEIIDDETGEFEVNVLPSGDYAENLEILSSIIADFSNFCDFCTYIKRYVEVKQEINKLNTDEDDASRLQIKKLDDDFTKIKEKIQNSVFESLDKIVNKKEKENKKE